MKGYVYAVEVVGHDLFKIGNSYRPGKRIRQIASQSPFPVRFSHLLDVGTKERAGAFEAFILGQCFLGFDHAEWVRGKAHVDRAFELVAPAVCRLEQFPGIIKFKDRARKHLSLDELSGSIQVADKLRQERVEYYANHPEFDRHGYTERAVS